MPDKLRSKHLPGRVFTLCGLLFLGLTLGGCVSKSKANAQARAAYAAGQQQAAMRMQQAQIQSQGPSVTINGDVRNHLVPWAEGLTLTKALVAAEYSGATDPAQIIIVRGGMATRLNPRDLFSGVDYPLQPGDIVQLLPQTGVLRQ